MSTGTACPGCGLILPSIDGPTHSYLNASPACWALYGEVLAREFGDPKRFEIHQVTVDTYAVQHSGGSDRRAVQSLALHLMTLCLFVERGVDPGGGPGLHQRLVGGHTRERLEPPHPNGSLTVAHAHEAVNAGDHIERVWSWARDVWQAWSPHHDTIHRWLDESFA